MYYYYLILPLFRVAWLGFLRYCSGKIKYLTAG